MNEAREAPSEEELDYLEPVKPTIDVPQQVLEEREVSYEWVRGPRDFVISGPLLAGWGPGRYMQSRVRAEAWCRAKYGEANVKQLGGQTKGRWAFLIKRGCDA